jgi:hypothetical protein
VDGVAVHLPPLSKEGAFVEGLGGFGFRLRMHWAFGPKKKVSKIVVVEVKIYTTFAPPYEGLFLEKRGCWLVRKKF